MRAILSGLLENNPTEKVFQIGAAPVACRFATDVMVSEL